MTSKNDPALAAWLIDRFGVHGEGAGLLDEDLVVGYAEGRLSEEERAAVEGLLARDPEARDVLGLARAGARDRTQGRRRWALPLAAAAVLLVAFGAALWLDRAPEDALPADGAARLLVLADRLTASHPRAFEGLRARIEASDPVELPPLERGGVRVLAPRGEVLGGSPLLRWEPVPGATGYAVRIAPADGQPVFESKSVEAQLRLPTALPAGAYVLEVTARTAFGTATGSSPFRRGGEAARREHARAVAAIEAAAPPEDRALLVVYYAVARERFAEAAAALGRHRSAHPDDPRISRAARVLGPLAE
jgi:hypothetical protein